MGKLEIYMSKTHRSDNIISNKGASVLIWKKHYLNPASLDLHRIVHGNIRIMRFLTKLSTLEMFIFGALQWSYNLNYESDMEFFSFPWFWWWIESKWNIQYSMFCYTVFHVLPDSYKAWNLWMFLIDQTNLLLINIIECMLLLFFSIHVCRF